MTSQIENCIFKYKCEALWEALERTEAETIRFCPECERNVYACHNDWDLAEHIRAGHCIALFRDDGAELALGEPASAYPAYRTPAEPPQLSEALLANYRKADYVFRYGQYSTKMKIGKKCDDLAYMMADFQATTAVFITPYNPHGELLGQEENLERYERFVDEIKMIGNSFFYGYGGDPDNEWPPEKSLLIFNLSRREANAIAKKYEQNAFVFVDQQAIPELVVTT